MWEIALHAYQIMVQEETLVTLPLEDGITCDVIGDVHGTDEVKTRLESVLT